MLRTQILLTEQQDRALARLAAERRASKAALVRQAVDLLIAQAGPGDERNRRWERALAFTGTFRSDRDDVAERHDDYLADAFAE